MDHLDHLDHLENPEPAGPPGPPVPPGPIEPQRPRLVKRFIKNSHCLLGLVSSSYREYLRHENRLDFPFSMYVCELFPERDPKKQLFRSHRKTTIYNPTLGQW